MKITVVGTGAFGTAIANTLIKSNSDVILYGISKTEIRDINNNSKNSAYYSKKLSSKLKATSDKKSAFANADIIILAIPSEFIETAVQKDIVPNLQKPAYFINLSKGLHTTKLKPYNYVLDDLIPKKMNNGILKLSGPSFASELFEKQPTIFVLASNNINTSKLISKSLSSIYIEIIPSDQIETVELVSILKNTYALALGMIAGLGYKMNTRAFLFTKILLEMSQILEVFDYDNSVLLSPAGVGDLYLTGSSRKSRNYRTGYKIGKSDKVTKKVLQSYSTLEGIRSIEPLIQLLNKKQIDLHILYDIYTIIYKKETPSIIFHTYFEK